MPIDSVSIKPVFLENLREQKLCYIDVHATKHAMCWKDSDTMCGTWVTACGFALFPRNSSPNPIDLRDVVMSFPSCIECIAASFTVET